MPSVRWCSLRLRDKYYLERSRGTIAASRSWRGREGGRVVEEVAGRVVRVVRVVRGWRMEGEGGEGCSIAVAIPAPSYGPESPGLTNQRVPELPQRPESNLDPDSYDGPVVPGGENNPCPNPRLSLGFCLYPPSPGSQPRVHHLSLLYTLYMLTWQDPIIHLFCTSQYCFGIPIFKSFHVNSSQSQVRGRLR